MSDKQKLIQEMMDMQKKFIAYEHEHGVDPKDYFTPEEGHKLHGYRQKYAEMAAEVIDLAHQEKSSKR